MSPRTTEQYEYGLESLLMDTERMEGLANRMLTLARLEEAAMEQGETSELRSAVRIVTERLLPLAELKQVRLDVSGEESGKVAM